MHLPMPFFVPIPSMTSISFLLLKLFFLGLNVAPFTAGDEHQFSYSGFSNTNLTLDGAASVTPSGLLMLTNGMTMSMGHAFYPTPLRFHNLSDGTVKSFSISFVFGIVSSYKDLSTDGIAMFIAPSKNSSGAMPIQYLGLLSNQSNGNQTNHIFAVELDTFQNWEFQDINGNHIGIDINSLHSIQSHDAGFYHDKDGTFQSLSLDSQEVMQVWVDYHREKMQINATMAPLGMAKPTRPTVSANYNLSTVLADVAYIGFSSAEGINTKHYVLGWSFGMNRPAPAINVTMLPKLPPGPHTKDRRRLRVLEIILQLAMVALILCVAAVVSLLVRRHFRYAELRDDWEVEFGPHRFSYRDLFCATQGFDDKNLLGAGGFGRVYRGELPRFNLKVAVKRVSHDSRQGMKEFIAEIVSIGRLQNPNLVHLLGYCRRHGELLLVYEYMPKGSLDKYLYGEVDNNSTLSWDRRFWIIRGIASALVYLHEEWEKVVVHRDIKASNVLLDDEFNGRLGDFGLARLYDHGTEQETTRVVGTFGYLAPELARTGKGTPLTDVFAFGVFILEVTCGKRPIMQSTQDEPVMLADWVLEHVQQGSLADAIDMRLKGYYNVGEAYLVLKLGLLCSHPFACARPSMRQVIQYLDGHIEPPELPAHQSFQALALMQNEGFDPYIMSYPSSRSVGTISSISGGR